MPDTNDKLTKLVNASGFVLQLALEHAVRESRQQHGWTVLSREHPWQDAQSSGFADLIVGQGIIRLVIECKRARGGTWVFLASKGSQPTRRFRCQWADGVQKKEDLIGWDDFLLDPACEEAAFCVIRGTGEGNQSLIERIAGNLIQAAAPLAIEELNTLTWSGFSHQFLHVPVIVTTASLQLCRFDAGSVALQDGLLVEGAFEEVPYIRFRKSLAHDVNRGASLVDIGAIARDKERSIIVVNAASFLELLKALGMEAKGGYHNAPWVSARQVEARE